MNGYSIGGRNVNNTGYENDTAFVTDSVENIQVLVNVVNRASEEKGPKINGENTDFMVVLKRTEMSVCPKQIETQLVGEIEQFQYLESVLTAVARCKTKVKREVA